MVVRRIDADSVDWFKILNEPFVVLILGMRGSGKTALSHLLLELFSDQGRRRPAYIVGFPVHKRHLLPEWIHPLDDLEFPDNSVVLLHEAHMYLHARRSMSDQNIEVDRLITISRHKNVDIIIETQQSFRLDKNIVAGADAIIYRVPALMQRKFERPELRKIVEMAEKAFEPYVIDWEVVKDNKVVAVKREIKPDALKRAFIYSQGYTGVYPHDIPLPSYWNEEISRAFGELREDRLAEAALSDPLISLLISDRRYVEILKNALEKERELEEKGIGIGWEAYEVGANWREISKLVNMHIVRISMKTNRHTNYKIVDKNRVVEALKKIEEEFK